MATSPTQLSLKKLRADGYLTAVVEHWNPHAKIRQDLFGIIDVLGVRLHTLAVQCTSDSHVAERVRKLQESPHLGVLLKANWAVEVWGWKKVKNRWQVRKVIL